VKSCCFTCHNNNIQQWSFDQLKHKKYQHPHLPFIHKTSNPHILHTEHQYCIKWRALPLFTDKPTKLISVKISKYFRYWTLKRLQNFLWIGEENHLFHIRKSQFLSVFSVMFCKTLLMHDESHKYVKQLFSVSSPLVLLPKEPTFQSSTCCRNTSYS